jgi:predicted  nucleic acid-binding Zn-ribbon protein
MADLGRKYTCYSCHTKFYDLGKLLPLCPKCGADQRDAEEKPAVPAHRGRAAARVVVVEEPPIEEEFPAEPEPVASTETEEEDVIPESEREEEPAEAEAEAEEDEEEELE